MFAFKFELRTKKCPCNLQGHFFVRTSNLKANIHIVDRSISIRQKQLYFKFLQSYVTVWRRLL